MTTWRVKDMSLAEWSEFQERFGEYQLLTGAHENLALFCQDTADAGVQSIYIAAPDLPSVERLSPGGWADASKPEGEDIALLVGSGDPWEHFGIQKRELR